MLILLQFVVLLVMLAIGGCVLYAIFEMREVYADHRDKFLRVVTSFEEFQKTLPQLLGVLERIEANGHALQKIAVQVEVAAAALKTSARYSSPIESPRIEPRHEVLSGRTDVADDEEPPPTLYRHAADGE